MVKSICLLDTATLLRRQPNLSCFLHFILMQSVIY